MERTQKLLEVCRLSFERFYDKILKTVDGRNPDITLVQSNFNILTIKNDEMMELNKKMLDCMLDSDCSADDIDSQVETADLFLSKFTTIKYRIEQLVLSDRLGNISVQSTSKTHLKYPKIEFKKFGGDLKDWLPFWHQFKRIDEDETVDPQDKFQFLIQATIPKSRARQLVESYPQTEENYYKALESLKARYGKEELLIEFYVRELLKLVLGNLETRPSLPILFDKLESQLRALETLNVTSEKYAAMLFPLVESSLPEDILRVWQRSLYSHENEIQGNSQNNKLKKLMEFLRREVENEEKISLAVSGFQTNRKKKDIMIQDKIPTATDLVNQQKKKFTCVFCKDFHVTDECPTASTMSIEKKKKILSETGRCHICTRFGHTAPRCRVKVQCAKCQKRHATVLCQITPVLPESETHTQQPTKDVKEKHDTVKNYSNFTYNEVFLQTLVVKIVGKNNLSRNVRCIIDTGSQRSYVNKFVAEDLELEAIGEEKLIHALFGGSDSETVVHKSYRIELHNINNQFACTFQVLDQPIICSNVVSVFTNGSWMQELNNFGITITDTKPGPIDILIGSDVAAKLLTGRKQGLSSGLVAVESELGWSLMGKAQISCSSDLICTSMLTTSLFCKSEDLSNLWKLDLLGIKDPIETKSKKEAELAIMKNFQETVTINEEDRYEVVLPWVEGHAPLPSNFSIAKRRLDNLMLKFNQDGHYKDCNQVFEEWLENGIIEKVPENEISNFGHYLPHRLVIKQESTTKFRPVFDASEHEKNHPSLNQCLEKGINFIELIPSILLKFRLGKYGIISDIRKAFLQISISKSNRDFLRFLWYTESGDLVYFRHQRVVFGLTCSPFHLGAVIQYHLSKEIENMIDKSFSFSKDTISKLEKSFYVDNCVTSVNTEKECSDFINESKAVMEKGQFDLRGWETTIFEKGNLPNENFLSSVLGLKWNRFEDTLELSFDWFDTVNFEKVTKRTVLSLANKIFDPIGIFSPCALFAKILLQKMWFLKISWDTEIPSELKTDFLNWAREIKLLVNLKIPRWLLNSTEATPDKWNIHLFVDASGHAYSAVLFLRSESLLNGVKIQLIQAKSRVAPVKKMSIPRLELMAATIGARLLYSVLENPELQNVPVFCWSDSSTVLSWIHQKDQWKTFVWNRVQEIRTITNTESWRFVPGETNPADLPSRGCSPKKLLESKWWEGPSWLYLPPEQWPEQKFNVDEKSVQEEQKKTTKNLINVKQITNWYYLRFSKYQQILNLVAWILRFFTNCKKKENGTPKIYQALTPLETKQQIKDTVLSMPEIENAEIYIVKMIQEESFIKIDEDPVLKSLQPFKDDQGVIRLKTRIVDREDSQDFKYPIILPSNHPVVIRMIIHYHERNSHVGTQALLTLLRERFWIIKGRKTVKSVISKCVICRRYEAKHFETPILPLPKNRITDAAVFEVTGVDLAGPLYIRNNEKVWICIYTCAVYRAVHLELVSSLSTDSFLQSLRKFISRRGRPRLVYSDNGKNFLGSDNAFKSINWDTIQEFNNIERIIWNFNPPTAAWWGGWWERLIRLLKQLLKKTLGRTSLNYEELQTILCECEALMNSRPLTYVSEEKDDLVPLTPAMFLQDIQTTNTKDIDVIDHNHLNKHLKYRLKLKEDLSKRFRSEYLGQLVMKKKLKDTKPIKIGDIVLIGSETKKVNWPMGLVVETYPGKDKKVRVVKLKTTNGTVIRPVQRLYSLEVSSVEAETLHKKVEINNQLNFEVEDKAEEPTVRRSQRKRFPPKKYED